MFAKLCRNTLWKNSAKFDLSKLNIKYMLPETTDEQVRKEVDHEIKTVGWNSFRKLMGEEQKALELLKSRQEQILKQVENYCLVPALKRAKDGYKVSGLFWSKTQETLRHFVKQEEVMELQQKIDWLNTRQAYKKSLDESYNQVISLKMGMGW